MLDVSGYHTLRTQQGSASVIFAGVFDIVSWPGRPWSLWEMVNFFFGPVCLLIRDLDILISISYQNMRVLGKFGTNENNKEAIDKSIKMIESCVQVSEKHFAKLRCRHIDNAIRRLQHFLQISFEWSELNTRSRALRDAIEVELRYYLYYQYPKQKGEMFLIWKDEWKVVITAFPSVHYDVTHWSIIRHQYFILCE